MKKTIIITAFVIFCTVVLSGGILYMFHLKGEMEYGEIRMVQSLYGTPRTFYNLSATTPNAKWNVIKSKGEESKLIFWTANAKDKKTELGWIPTDNNCIGWVDKYLYYENNTRILDDKNKDIKLKCESSKCGGQNCYHITLTDAAAVNIDNYVKLGEDSQVVVYQDINLLSYDLEWAYVNITLFKNISGEYTNTVNNIFVRYDNISYKFGANDSSNEDVEHYMYKVKSTLPISSFGNQPYITNPNPLKDNFELIYETHVIDFSDICGRYFNATNNSAECEFKYYDIEDNVTIYINESLNDTVIVTNYYLDVYFYSDYAIDPTINITNVSLADSINKEVVCENNFCHSNVSFPYSHINLSVYLPFDVNHSPSKTVYDYTNNNINGVASGTAKWSNNGKHGGAYWFDGNSDDITLGTQSNYLNNNNLTVSFWMYGENIAPSFRGLVAKGGTTSNKDWMIVTSGARLCLWTETGGDNYPVQCGAYGLIQNNTWHHVLYSFPDSGATTVYLDGAFYDTQGSSRSITEAPVKIGSAASGASIYYWQGMIDDVMILNNVSLSAIDALAIYSNQSQRFKQYGNQTFRPITDFKITRINSLNNTASFSTFVAWDDNAHNDVPPPANSLPPSTVSQHTNAQYAAISTKDNVYYDISCTDDYECYTLYNATIPVLDGIEYIEWEWEGYQTESGGGGAYFSFWVWNNTGSAWVNCTTNAIAPASNINKRCIIYNNMDDYYDANHNSYFMAYLSDINDADGVGPHHITDYAGLNVKYNINKLNLTVNHEALQGSNLSARIGQINDSLDNLTGLILYMPFEWGEALDISGYGNDGTIDDNNHVTWNTSDIIGGAMYFNGVDDNNPAIEIPESELLNLSNRSMFTLSTWVNWYDKAGTTENGLIAKQNDYILWIYDDGRVLCGIDDLGTAEYAITSSTLNPHTWYHIACVANVTWLGIYIDAIENKTNTNLNAPEGYSPNNLRLGSFGASNYFEGMMDEVRIYNRSLTSHEIETIYNNGLLEYGKPAYTDWKNLSSDSSQNDFSIDSNADFIWTEFRYYSGFNQFYSPILMNDITLETWNTTGVAAPPPPPDTSVPEVNNSIPINNTKWTANNTVFFAFLTNESGTYTLYINNTVNNTGAAAIGNNSFHQPIGNGSYIWNVTVDDGTNVGHSAYFNLTVAYSQPDTSLPSVNNSIPINNTKWTANNTVFFAFLTNESGNYTLHINNTVNATGYANIGNNSFHQPIGNGDYFWNITVNDSTNVGHSAYFNLTVAYSAPPPPTAAYNVTLVYPTNASTINQSINLTYNVSVGMNNCSLWINDSGTFRINQTVAGTEMSSYLCYQENASQATACGGLGTGVYTNASEPYNKWDVVHDAYWYLAFDGNWDTAAYVDDGLIGRARIYINYSIPPNAQRSSLWQVRKTQVGGITRNLTINTTCWDYGESVDTLVLLGDSICWDEVNFRNNWSCYNGSDWIMVSNNTDRDLYEEAMWWNISNSTGTVTPNQNNTFDISEFSEGHYTWNVNCYNGSNSYWAENNYTFTLSTAPPPPDTCTYTSGNWHIDLSDYCHISSPTYVQPYATYCYGSGGLYVESDLYTRNITCPFDSVYIDTNGAIYVELT